MGRDKGPPNIYGDAEDGSIVEGNHGSSVGHDDEHLSAQMEDSAQIRVWPSAVDKN